MKLIDVYIIFFLSLSVIIISSAILIRVLSRNPKNRLNQMLLLTFTCYLIHFLLVFYRSNVQASDMLIHHYLLYIISFYFLGLGIVFLTLYIAILFRPERMIKTKNQGIHVLIYAGLLAIIFLIPGGVLGDLDSDGVFADAVFSFPITLYLMCLFTAYLMPSIYISINIRKSFSDPELAKKLRLITLLLYFYFYHLYGVTLTNFLNDPIIRSGFYISEVVSIIVLIAIYFALAKGFSSMEKQE